MSDGIRVNHGSLDQGSADLATGVKNIEARLSQLEGELKLLQSDWTGQAQAAYTTAKAQWDGAMEEMKQLLADTSVAVSTTNDGFRDADKRGMHRFEG